MCPCLKDLDLLAKRSKSISVDYRCHDAGHRKQQETAVETLASYVGADSKHL